MKRGRKPHRAPYEEIVDEILTHLSAADIASILERARRPLP